MLSNHKDYYKGRQLDARIGELIFQKEVIWEDPTGFDFDQNFGPTFPNEINGCGEHRDVPFYSSSLRGYQKLLAKVAEDNMVSEVKVMLDETIKSEEESTINQDPLNVKEYLVRIATIIALTYEKKVAKEHEPK